MNQTLFVTLPVSLPLTIHDPYEPMYAFYCTAAASFVYSKVPAQALPPLHSHPSLPANNCDTTRTNIRIFSIAFSLKPYSFPCPPSPAQEQKQKVTTKKKDK